VRWDDNMSGEVLLSVVCLSVIVKPHKLGGPGSLAALVP